MGTHMFDRYPQPEGYIPNNHPKCKCDGEDIITVGGTTTLVFSVPSLNIRTDLNDLNVIFTLGTTTVLVKNRSDITYIEGDDHTFKLVLEPNETILFKDSLLDTVCQLRFSLTSGIVDFSEKIKLVVRQTLNN